MIEPSLHIHQTVWCYIPEVLSLHHHPRENLKSHTVIFMVFTITQQFSWSSTFLPTWFAEPCRFHVRRMRIAESGGGGAGSRREYEAVCVSSAGVVGAALRTATHTKARGAHASSFQTSRWVQLIPHILKRPSFSITVNRISLQKNFWPS